MSDERRDLVVIDWRRSLGFLEILRAFRIAINPVSLMLCLVGLAATVGVGIAIDQVPGIGCTVDKMRTADLDFRGTYFENMYDCARRLWSGPVLSVLRPGPLDELYAAAHAPVAAVTRLVNLAMAYWTCAPWFSLVNTILALAIWATVGGAVTRIAAVRVAREESVPWKSAVRFSCSKWLSLASSPLVPFGVLVLLAILVGLPSGLFLMVPYAGEVVVGIMFGLVLAIGLVLALILIGGLCSLGLQWPTIAAEGSDAFDAISRSVSYISSRPWRYLFYTAFSAVYGCLTFVFVKLLAFATLWVTHEAVGVFTWKGSGIEGKLDRLWSAPTWSGGPWPASGNQLLGLEDTAAYFFAFWVWIVLGFMIAFLISFFFSSQTVIYFLLRREVDATDMEEVYMEESEEDELPVGEAAPQPPVPPSDEAGTALSPPDK